MATKKISELTAKGATLGATDLLEISEGGTVTKSVTGANIPNFANTALTFTANRTHDLAGYVATLDNAELKVISDANAETDIPFQVTKTNGNDRIIDVRGNGIVTVGNTTFNSDYTVSVDGTIGTYGGMYISRVGGGIPLNATGGVYNEFSGASTTQIRAVGAAVTGVYGFCTTGIGVLAETTDTGLALKTIGKVRFDTLPTSAAGLSTGDVWNDSGTLKIV